MKIQNLLVTTIILSLSLAVGGCVTKSKYVELEGKYKNVKQEKTATEKDCRDRESSLEAELDTAKSRGNDLEQENQDLKNARDALAAREQARKEELRRVEENMRQMKESLEGQLEKKEARISRIENTLKIELVDKLFFKSGSATISRKGGRLLAKIAPILKNATDKEIRVIGHADKLPPSRRLAKKFPSNWELSSIRATAIIRVLQWGYKVDPRRLSAVGVAHYRPVAIRGADGRKTRRSNRVVEIILSPLKVR